LFVLNLISEISDTAAQTPSNIIKGIYFMRIEAIQAVTAPIKFNKIKDRSLLFIFPKTLRM
jgi:hypothetical protein